MAKFILIGKRLNLYSARRTGIYWRARSSLGKLLRALPEWDNPPIMGAIVNGELRELTYPIEIDSRIRLVTMADDDGARIYRRSITFLLEAAFEELFPNVSMTLDHSVSAGGYFCQVAEGDSIDKEDLAVLKSANANRLSIRILHLSEPRCLCKKPSLISNPKNLMIR